MTTPRTVKPMAIRQQREKSEKPIKAKPVIKNKTPAMPKKPKRPELYRRMRLLLVGDQQHLIRCMMLEILEVLEKEPGLSSAEIAFRLKRPTAVVTTYAWRGQRANLLRTVNQEGEKFRFQLCDNVQLGPHIGYIEI